VPDDDVSVMLGTPDIASIVGVQIWPATKNLQQTLAIGMM